MYQRYAYMVEKAISSASSRACSSPIWTICLWTRLAAGCTNLRQGRTSAGVSRPLASRVKGLNVKIHSVCDALGNSQRFVLTACNAMTLNRCSNCPADCRCGSKANSYCRASKLTILVGHGRSISEVTYAHLLFEIHRNFAGKRHAAPVVIQ